MIYEIVLIDGHVLTCWTKDYDAVLRMMVEHEVFIVKENSHPDKTTYVLRDRVSHYRFPSENSNVIKPV